MNGYKSHEQSLEILNLLYGYDSFLDSLKVIYDIGSGHGLDAKWWATLETRDDPPEPRNYRVYAIDKDHSKAYVEATETKGIRWIQQDFEKLNQLPEKADLIWCHDAFQYAVNPLSTLHLWNKSMNKDGMLVLSFPQNIGYVYNRLQFRTENYSYFNHNITSLIYMLAVNGFDCNDAYFYKNVHTNQINAAVYKAHEPLDPQTTSLHDLADMDLLHPSIVTSLNTHGFIRQEDVVYSWLDKDFYQVKT